MRKLEPPVTFYLSGAVGWMELGNLSEAWEELKKVPADWKNHPEVLEVTFVLQVEAKDWEGALETARALVEGAPERSSGWLHQAYALRRVAHGGVEKAWLALLPAAEKFRDEEMIPYNLACYACQMGDLTMARRWLKRASKLAGIETIKQMALADSDLEPLWPEVKGM